MTHNEDDDGGSSDMTHHDDSDSDSDDSTDASYSRLEAKLEAKTEALQHNIVELKREIAELKRENAELKRLLIEDPQQAIALQPWELARIKRMRGARTPPERLEHRSDRCDARFAAVSETSSLVEVRIYVNTCDVNVNDSAARHETAVEMHFNTDESNSGATRLREACHPMVTDGNLFVRAVGARHIRRLFHLMPRLCLTQDGYDGNTNDYCSMLLWLQAALQYATKE
ncbi:Hypothetical protein UVM_LOCUS474 [uncultured virus]|nr:Hypothetical protein UVM_LOCUS474 [uncultured virus]